jgi:hypothetical protein
MRERPTANREAVTISGPFQLDIHVLPRGIRMFWFAAGQDLAQEWARQIRLASWMGVLRLNAAFEHRASCPRSPVD